MRFSKNVFTTSTLEESRGGKLGKGGTGKWEVRSSYVEKNILPSYDKLNEAMGDFQRVFNEFFTSLCLTPPSQRSDPAAHFFSFFLCA